MIPLSRSTIELLQPLTEVRVLLECAPGISSESYCLGLLFHWGMAYPDCKLILIKPPSHKRADVTVEVNRDFVTTLTNKYDQVHLTCSDSFTKIAHTIHMLCSVRT